MAGSEAGPAYRRLEQAAEVLARYTAFMGGVVLVALVAVTVVSIGGRILIPFGLGPVPGDFELVEAGTAFAIFAFMPWCHLNRGHATVEIFAGAFSNRANRAIDLLWNIVMLAAMALITWRFWLGTLDKMSNGESTFILQMPVWWGYMASFVAASVFVLICAFCVLRSYLEFRQNTLVHLVGGQH